MRSIRPATGARLIWQLNTLMKIEMRGSGLSPRPSSAGGTACAIIEMRPSAGATTMPSRTGVTRTGSRKNSAHQMVNTVPIQPSGAQIQNRNRLTSAKPPMNGYPSGWIGEICARMELAMDMRSTLTLPCCEGELSSWRSRQAERQGHALFRGGCDCIIDRRRSAVGRLVVVVDQRQPFARLLGLALPAPHAGIEPVPRQQLTMGSALGDAAGVEHDDLVGADNGRKPMSNHQRCAVFRDPLQRLLDLVLGVAVERARRLVQHQNRRRLQHRTRNRDPLLLAARQFQATLADLGLVALWRHADEAIDLREPRSALDLGIGRTPAAVANVVADGIVEQHGILRHHADRRSQRLLRHAPDVLAVDRDGPA